MCLAPLFRDILTAKFQSEQFLPTTCKKFWINSLLNLFSLYSSTLFSSSQCIHDSAPRITHVCSIQKILCYYKSFRSFILTYFLEYCTGISFKEWSFIAFQVYTWWKIIQFSKERQLKNIYWVSKYILITYSTSWLEIV